MTTTYEKVRIIDGTTTRDDFLLDPSQFTFDGVKLADGVKIYFQIPSVDIADGAIPCVSFILGEGDMAVRLDVELDEKMFPQHVPKGWAYTVNRFMEIQNNVLDFLDSCFSQAVGELITCTVSIKKNCHQGLDSLLLELRAGQYDTMTEHLMSEEESELFATSTY